ncbi:MAG TPA: flagellin, partial [Spirochaetota bacterium]
MTSHSYVRSASLTVLNALLILLPCLSPASAQTNRFLFIPQSSNFYVYGNGSENFIITQNRITEWELDKTIARLSSGQRINNASDDPSGLAVSEKMNSFLNQLKQESANDEDMKNFYSYTESVIGQDQDIVRRIRELILRSTGGILTPEDREFNQTEIEELIEQIDMNARFSQLNKIRVISQLTAESLGLTTI